MLFLVVLLTALESGCLAGADAGTATDATTSSWSSSACSVPEEQQESLAGSLICHIEPSRSDFERNNLQIYRWRERYSITFAQSESTYLKSRLNLAANGSLFIAAPIDREELCSVMQICCSPDLLCDIPLRLRLSGAGKLALFTSVLVLIDINDNAPRFDQASYEIEVSESVPLGHQIPLPSATDGDSRRNNIERYDWRWKSKAQRPFDLKFGRSNATTRGSSNVADVYLQTTAKLDRERNSVYEFTLFVYDSASAHTGSTEIKIVLADVNDNAPQFAKASYSVTIAENSIPSTVIMQLGANDPDDSVNGEIEYSLKGDSSALEKFSIDHFTGALQLIDSIDYEKQREFRLLVQASDRSPTNALTGHAEVHINVTNVNDEAPRIALELLSDTADRDTIELSESTPVGTLIGLLQASDADSPFVQCTLSGTKFRLVRSVPNATEFRILTTATFDRETSSVEMISVTCADQGDRVQLTSSTTVRVNIRDENDCSPEFLFAPEVHPSFRDGVLHLQMSENNNPGDLLFDLQASDRDDSRNGQLSYSLSTGGTECCQLEGDGRLVARRMFDREEQSEYRMRAEVCDNGSSPRCSSISIQLTVLDVNDNVPTWQPPSITLNVNEAVANGTRVATFDVTDEDIGDNGMLELAGPFPISTIDYTDVRTTFQLVNRSLFVTKLLDRELIQTYYFVLTAADFGQPRLTSSTTVTLVVTDANDHAPLVELRAIRNNTVRISYAEPVGSIVCEMTAFDQDSADNGKLSVAINEGNELGLFSLRSVSRHEQRRRIEYIAVSIAKGMTRAHVGNHSIRVIVQDCGVPPRSTEQEITIIVENTEPRGKPYRNIHSEEGVQRTYSEPNWTRPLLFICFIIVTIVLVISVIAFLYFRFIHNSNQNRRRPARSGAAGGSKSKQQQNRSIKRNASRENDSLWCSGAADDKMKSSRAAADAETRRTFRSDQLTDIAAALAREEHEVDDYSVADVSYFDSHIVAYRSALDLEPAMKVDSNASVNANVKTCEPVAADRVGSILASPNRYRTLDTAKFDQIECAEHQPTPLENEDDHSSSNLHRHSIANEENKLASNATRLFLMQQMRRNATSTPHCAAKTSAFEESRFRERERDREAEAEPANRAANVGAECDFQPRLVGSIEEMPIHVGVFTSESDQNFDSNQHTAQNLLFNPTKNAATWNQNEHRQLPECTSLTYRTNKNDNNRFNGRFASLNAGRASTLNRNNNNNNNYKPPYSTHSSKPSSFV